MSTLLASDIRRAQADPSLVLLSKYADHYVVSVHDDAKSVTFGYAAATTTIGYVRLRRGEFRGQGDRWEYRIEGDSEFRGMDDKTRRGAVSSLLGDVVRRLNREEQPHGYIPAHPIKAQVVVTLSNGKQVNVEITERESSERGDAWGAIFPAGVLTGHMTRLVQHELRDARERAEAYPR